MKKLTFVIISICLCFFNIHGLSKTTSGAYPFAAFLGTWTLKNQEFRQIWDTKTLQIVDIPSHFTNCNKVNTEKSMLCVIESPGLSGHIMWSFNADKQTVHHLSHFGDSRNGVGIGALDQDNNLHLRVSFQGEPEGSYRIYRYIWISEDEYSMKSTQYNKQHQPTGNFYSATFVKVKD